MSIIINSILWGVDQDFSHTDARISNTLVGGGAPGTDNLDLDPLFVDPEQGDFRLRDGSPAIDAGTADGAAVVDLDGNERPLGGGVDMGAYEYVPR